MIEIPHTDGFYTRDWTDGAQCIVCRKPMGKVKHWIKSIYGSHAVTSAEAEEIYRRDGTIDSGYYEVGPDCLRNHPELKPYVEDAAHAWGGMLAHIDT